ncbi:YdcF family protein [Dokdonella sp.]|uniref:YdcF family protein n=1 Tax=Dokdonella sp. TaxID=2291710 RepID=UPI002605CAE7|nr:YdcF family protein [Dokdonella sp.]
MLLTRLVDFAISPLGFGLLLALLLWRTRRHAPRWLWHLGAALEVVCFLLATPFGAQTLAALQERRIAAEVCPAADAAPLVLLAGGLRRAPRDADDVAALSEASLRRTIETAARAGAAPAMPLVISGGVWPGEAVAESTLMATLMSRLGVPAASIRTETGSHTTWQNAFHVRALDPPLPARIRLATSAVHMPRSLLAFRVAGFEPCAVPIDVRAARLRYVTDFLPSGGAIALSTAVLHEWVGEVGYRLRPGSSSDAGLPEGAP